MSYGLKRILIIISLIACILILVFVVVSLAWKGFPTATDQPYDAAKKTGELMKEMTKEAEEGNNTSKTANFTKTAEEDGLPVEEEIIETVIVAEGSNPINIDTGEVLSRDGQGAADNSGPDSSDSAPIQSAPVDSNKLPESVIKLVFNQTEVSPQSFKVKTGQAVSLAVTATDFVEVFKFKDPSLSAVAVGVMQGDTSVISFNAPAQKGEYVFYSDVPGRKNIIGRMIVE